LSIFDWQLSIDRRIANWLRGFPLAHTGSAPTRLHPTEHESAHADGGAENPIAADFWLLHAFTLLYQGCVKAPKEDIGEKV
jgi:hypothetical protein